MSKKELLKKTNWTRKDIMEYFGLSKWQLKYAIRKSKLKPLKVNSKKFSIEVVLEAFGSTLEREVENNK